MSVLPIRVTVDGISKVDQLTNSVKRLETSADRTSKSTSSLSAGLKTLATGAVAYIAIDRLASSMISLSKSFVQTADQMSMINSRLALVTSGTQQLANAQSQLLKISNDSRVSLQSTSDLYTQLARSTQSLGLSQDYLLGVTETISQTLTISGASAQSASASLFQLSQGLSAGALRGEELNSVLEQTPRLAQAIADGLGVSIGELRKLGSEGALTAETVLKALENQAQTVASEFNNIAITAEGGYQVLSNSIDQTIAKLNEQNQITTTIGTAFQALSESVSTLMTTAFNEITGEAIDFGEFTVESITSVIEMGGILYDTFESIGDVFKVIGYSGEVAFYGFQAITSSVATSIANTFEVMTNSIIDGINQVISFANSTGFFNISQIGYVDFDIAGKLAREISVKSAYEQSQSNLLSAYSDLGSVSTVGRDTASTMISQFTSAFAELRAKNATSQQTSSPISTNGTTTPITDYNSIYQEELAKQQEYTKEALENYYNTTEDLNEATEDTTETVKDFIDTFYNDNDSLYETISNTTPTVSKMSDAFNNLDYGLNKVTDSLETFIFQFNDVLFNSLESNSNALRQIGQSTAFNSISYSEALIKASEARDQLIANPLSNAIGELYTEAYNTFISSASDYLDPANFRSIEEYRFAQSTVGTQARQLEATAGQGADVLDSMNTFLQSINEALEDGVLTNEESIALTGLSDELNTKNEQLLGSSSALVGSTNGINYGINTLGVKTDNVANKTNTVGQYITSLRGGKSSGIAIADVLGTVDGLQVATGLDTPISNLNTTTSSVVNATSGVTNAVNATSIKGSSVPTLDNLRLKSERTTIAYYLGNALSGESTALVPTTAGNAGYTVETTSYQYYAKGGFTGSGMGQRDHTGYKQAGIVHEDEWVAPKWMLKQNPQLFNNLESVRQKGSFAQGGFTTPSFNVSASLSGGEFNQMQRDISELKQIFLNITENGNLMNVRLAG